MSGYPLLHPGLTPAQDWLDQGASLDSDKWVSAAPSWSDSLHHYQSDQRHVWTQMSGYPLLHRGLTPAQDWSDQGHVWTQMSGYPLLHPGLCHKVTTRMSPRAQGLSQLPN